MTSENKDAVEVTVQLTPQDVCDLWRSSGMRYLEWVLVPCGLYLSYVVFAEIVNCGFCAETAFSIILNGLVAILAFCASFLLLPLRARQLIRGGPTLSEPRRYFFSADGVGFDSKLATGTWRWGAFSRITESQKSFLLYLSPVFGTAIPKKCFAGPDEMSRLRDLFRTHFTGKLKLRP